MPIRLQLEVPRLAGLLERVAAEFGPDARIAAVEPVTTGGFFGFFAHRSYRVLVDVGSARTSRPAAPSGLAALLDSADAAESGLAVAPPALPRGAESLSTGSADFSAVLAGLIDDTAQRPIALPSGSTPAAPAAPFPPEPGALVVVLGLGDDARDVVHDIAGVLGALVGEGIGGSSRMAARRQSLELRARAVEESRAACLAWPGGAGRDGIDLDAVQALGADRLWLVVDAGRKAADTATWVAAVRERLPVHALAVIGRELTASPETVDALGIPIGWVRESGAVRPAGWDRVS